MGWTVGMCGTCRRGRDGLEAFLGVAVFSTFCSVCSASHPACLRHVVLLT